MGQSPKLQILGCPTFTHMQVGGSSPLGTWGYLQASEELRQQTSIMDISDVVMVSTDLESLNILWSAIRYSAVWPELQACYICTAFLCFVDCLMTSGVWKRGDECWAMFGMPPCHAWSGGSARVWCLRRPRWATCCVSSIRPVFTPAPFSKSMLTFLISIALQVALLCWIAHICKKRMYVAYAVAYVALADQ